MENIRIILKDQRLQNHYSIRQLSFILNNRYHIKASKSTIQRLENSNTAISAQLLCALADLYELDLEELKGIILKSSNEQKKLGSLNITNSKSSS